MPPARKIRRYSPCVMRHTVASWLVQAGVPLYDVHVLFGHEAYETTQRYPHLPPEVHGKILGVWERRTLSAVGEGSVGGRSHLGDKKGRFRSSEAAFC
ncbi:tyrosine-type recombinase/integrase [Nonomuraea sp. NPDC049750]|uniref:tyrosine-type recombinase/integrase n=1 Tax=Nonomuraea sp. NPDC049750 TaxID=3154738 RepID=UPI0033C5FA74